LSGSAATGLAVQVERVDDLGRISFVRAKLGGRQVSPPRGEDGFSLPADRVRVRSRPASTSMPIPGALSRGVA
jgi:hypothetical protein